MNGLTRRERLVTDRDKILEILDKAKVMHLGMVDGDEPYIVPMNYGYTFEDDKLTIWLHGALRGRKYDLIRKNPKVCFEMECDLVPFEGDVACRYGISYSSLMGRGIAHIIEDVSEKQKALSILMKTQTDEHFEFNEKLASVVGIIRIDVIDYTAKHRPMPEK
ncbi:MAG: pyridoxamine 5'-phosphate oxidase family protein [Ruminococcaceae bacterium]|nr:pyridoxamine 5'-phosphate oxidase family protein [Oscillospiraceae bacterium]